MIGETKAGENNVTVISCHLLPTRAQHRELNFQLVLDDNFSEKNDLSSNSNRD